MRPLYLDHNATTPMLPEAWEAMRPFAGEAFGNPSSAHAAGRRARQALEDAREKVADLLGAHADEVIFTSGATEANNLALFGLCGALAQNLTPRPPLRSGEGETEGSAVRFAPRPPLSASERGPGGEVLPAPHLLASPIEHPCVVEPLKQLETQGFEVEWLPVSARGVVAADAVAERIRPGTRLVSVMLVNHETGAIQPVRDIAAAVPAGVAVHTDAAQAVGKMPVSFRDLGVTALTASAHKFRGPKGIGVLVIKRGTKLRPLLFGGHQQGGRRPGTEAVALAVGMAVALARAVHDLEANHAILTTLRLQLWKGLRERADPVVWNGPDIESSQALPTTLNVSFPGCRADVLLMSLDLAGVACSTGSACSSGSLLPSPVLAAMGVPDDVLRSAMRFSLAATLTAEDIDEAVRRIAECVMRMRAVV